MIENKQPDGTKTPNWFKRHKKLVIILSVVLAVLIGGGIATGLYFFNQKPAPAPIQSITPAPKPKPPVKYYSPLTGNEVPNEATTQLAVTGIMIENSLNARPQSGLKDSGVIFEAVAEGGITRFLVLYQEQKPQLIGPVRSVRIYYIDWLAAFNASIAHVGGSPNALAEVRNGSYRDIDQFFNAGSYWRATDRYAPHNVYTSFERLDALNAAKGYTTSIFTGFSRKDSKPLETPIASQISVTISSASFNSTYTYNPATNLYDRSQAGAAHTDREGGQISPRVVVVMKASQRIGSDGSHLEMDTIGSGIAYVFQDGDVHEVTWSKASKTDQIKFTTAEGQDFRLARGQTIISAVPADTGGVTWQ
jgi:hypothetical protein